MEIIVPANSSIASVNDIKGHDLVLTEPGSNSGFKAALVLLKSKGLLPVRDFSIRYSNGHDQSIAGIAAGQYEVAAVASDVLTRELAAGNIKKEQYKTIHSSNETFPTAAFGYVYNLKPDLAKKVTDAFFSFNWKASGLEKEFAASGYTKFVPVDYSKDWGLVRQIDNEIRSTQSLESVLAATNPTTEVATTGPTTVPVEPPDPFDREKRR
jgi:phosphonate transport system substrate-binding protein